MSADGADEKDFGNKVYVASLKYELTGFHRQSVENGDVITVDYAPEQKFYVWRETAWPVNVNIRYDLHHELH